MRGRIYITDEERTWIYNRSKEINPFFISDLPRDRILKFKNAGILQYSGIKRGKTKAWNLNLQNTYVKEILHCVLQCVVENKDEHEETTN